MSTDKVLYIRPELERPKYSLVAEHLWGNSIDIDSDGDSKTPNDKNWTELTLINRSSPSQRIDIDPVHKNPLILKIVGPESLVVKVANYLAMQCKCEVKCNLNEYET